MGDSLQPAMPSDSVDANFKPRTARFLPRMSRCFQRDRMSSLTGPTVMVRGSRCRRRRDPTPWCECVRAHCDGGVRGGSSPRSRRPEALLPALQRVPPLCGQLRAPFTARSLGPARQRSFGPAWKDRNGRRCRAARTAAAAVSIDRRHDGSPMHGVHRTWRQTGPARALPRHAKQPVYLPRTARRRCVWHPARSRPLPARRRRRGAARSTRPSAASS